MTITATQTQTQNKFNLVNMSQCLHSANINKLLIENGGVSKLLDILATFRLMTICLDGWTKKDLPASFLGISVFLSVFLALQQRPITTVHTV